MAFHFNWSPLIADTDRVRHMLTASLNKSPKPPIIVDDILVNELNLGLTPPSLEILEIGDLAEDRFRGIFHVRYAGDAYLQLRTKVQANPLNTFLSTKPSFAGPAPLAAASGLTIPLQITLSDIRISAFVILVFSKQKGITLVFRNDPLESLKVSSTFDSIPFIRDYLQKTIEGQLRVLFMEDLPAIIHRLSLRVFDSEYCDVEHQEPAQSEQDTQKPVDPFASPAQQDVDGEELPSSSFLSFGSQSDIYASFSQKNVLRLAALTESQRTLSLFTPTMRDTVYRAWAGTADRNEHRDGAWSPLHRSTNLARIKSSLNMSHPAFSSTASQASDTGSQTTRPSLASFSSMHTTHSLGSGRSRAHGTRKRKHRVVNLRQNQGAGSDGASDAVSVSSGYTESASRTESLSGTGPPDPTTPLPASASVRAADATASSSALRERDVEVQTPNTSPRRKVGFQEQRPPQRRAEELGSSSERAVSQGPATPRHLRVQPTLEDMDPTPRASMYLPPKDSKESHGEEADDPKRKQPSRLPKMQTLPSRPKEAPGLHRSTSDLSISDLAPAFQNGSSGGILEQAWMMKMATEIARRVAEEKAKAEREEAFVFRRDAFAGKSADTANHWQSEDAGEDAPPPAYVS